MVANGAARSSPAARLAWVALALAGCGGSARSSSSASPDAGSKPAQTADEIEAVTFPSTVELDQAGLAALDRSDDDGTLHFTTVPAALGDMSPGRILVAGVGKHTPAGLLRAVLAVERDGQGLTLRTAQVPIQLAYRKLHAKAARSSAAVGSGSVHAQVSPLSLPGGGPSSSWQAAPIGGNFDATQPFDYVLFDGDGDPGTTDDRIAIDGTIGGGFDYEFGLDVDWGDITELPDAVASCIKSLAGILAGMKPSCSVDALLPEAKVQFTVHPTVHADANVHGAAILDYEKDVDLASTTLAPIILGPLVFVPVVDLTAELHGGASAQFSTGIHGSAVFETSVSVSSKHPGTAQVSDPKLERTDFGPNDTNVTLQADAKVGVGARLNLLLFGITGPYATARAFGAIHADLLETPCWSLHAGVDIDLGIRVTSPALPLLGHVTLVDWKAPALTPLELEIAKGDCKTAPDAPQLPPGGGPDATRLAHPTFTPWSRAYASPVEGAIAGSPGNGVDFADAQRTIDGRTVRAGSGVKALTKIDDQSGDASWAQQLSFDDQPVRPLRVLSVADASLLVLAHAVTAPVLLTRLAQDGSVQSARAFDIALDVCTVEVAALCADGAGGAYVAGSCGGTSKSFVLHASADGSNDTLLLLDPGNLNAFRVRAAASIDKDAFVSGTLSDGNDAMFAVRLAPDGTIAYAKRYTGCTEAPDAIPSQILVGKSGDITIAGSGGAQHNGIVVRLKPDGGVGFASFPGFGFGAGSVFVLDSIAELPTTGYVAGGSAVRLTGPGTENIASAALVGFDAVGRIQWAKRYLYSLAQGPVASGQVTIHVTDDGGVLATALVVDSADPLGGFLWAWKAFARDGSIDFAPGTVEVSTLAIEDLTCSLSDADFHVTASEGDFAGRSAMVSATHTGLTQSKQTE